MPLFKTEDQKQEAREAKEEQRQAKKEKEAQDKYLASPVGQAEAAYETGQTFFQATINISRVSGKASDLWGLDSTLTKHFDAVDTLGQIEELGWHLEHVGYVFVQTGEVSRDKLMSDGQVTKMNGYVEGIYLFRRSSAPPENHPSNDLA
jgi:hypothetical protein